MSAPSAPSDAASLAGQSEAILAMPDSISRAAAHLFGAHHACPVPLAAYCPPLNLRDLLRLKRVHAIRAHAYCGRDYIDPPSFFAALGANGVLPADQPPMERQRRMAAAAVACSLNYPLWRDELELLRLACDNDSPLPLHYFAEFGGRSTFFGFFGLGLAKWRHGRHAAVVPSQLAEFLRHKTGL